MLRPLPVRASGNWWPRCWLRMPEGRERSGRSGVPAAGLSCLPIALTPVDLSALFRGLKSSDRDRAIRLSGAAPSPPAQKVLKR